MSGKMKRYILVDPCTRNGNPNMVEISEEMSLKDKYGTCWVQASSYDSLLATARQLADQLQIAAHFVDAVSPWDMRMKRWQKPKRRESSHDRTNNCPSPFLDCETT
jgi:hypothetical protein